MRQLTRIAGLTALGLAVLLVPGQDAGSDTTLARNVASEALDEFWTLSDYFDAHPEQNALERRFAKRVAMPPEPVSGVPARVRVALVSPALQTSRSWRRTRKTITARLSRLGIAAEVEPYLSHPGTELRTKASQIAAALATDPDYLVFTVDSLRHRQIIERMIVRKRPKVILDNLITPMRSWGASQPFLYVGFDHARRCRLLASKFLASRPQPERYAIFYAAEDAMSRTRGELIRLALASESHKTLAARYYVGPNREKARRGALDLLRRDPSVTFIFSTSTEIALGVSDAIAELGRGGHVATNGWGGTEEELRRLMLGDLSATLMPMSDEVGIAIAEAIALDLAGRREEIPQVFPAGSVLVDAGATRSRVSALKRRAFRYSR